MGVRVFFYILSFVIKCSPFSLGLIATVQARQAMSKTYCCWFLRKSIDARKKKTGKERQRKKKGSGVARPSKEAKGKGKEEE